MPPFYIWMYEIFLRVNWQARVLLLSWVKLVPLFLLINESSYNIIWFYVLSFCISQVLCMLLIGILSLFFFRRQANLALLVVLSFFNYIFYLKFLFFYFFIVILVWNFYVYFIEGWFFWAVLNLRGLPPSPLFFIKSFSFFYIRDILIRYRIFIIIFSIPVIIIYIDIIIKSSKDIFFTSSILIFYFFIFFLFLLF